MSKKLPDISYTQVLILNDTITFMQYNAQPVNWCLLYIIAMYLHVFVVFFLYYRAHIGMEIWESSCSLASHSNLPGWTNPGRYWAGFHPSSRQGGGDCDESVAGGGQAQQDTQLCLTSGGGVWWVSMSTLTSWSWSILYRSPYIIKIVEICIKLFKWLYYSHKIMHSQ